MTRLEDSIRRAVADLQSLHAEFALVGGLAVSIRTEPRNTRDVDCAVAVKSDHQAEELVAALLARGYRMLAQVEQESVRRLATIRLTPPGEPGSTLDLLFSSSGIEAEIVAQAETLTVLPDIDCKVAALGHLIALKVLARDDLRRPQDRVDLVALLGAARTEDLEVARRAAALIAQRGFARDKPDLSRELERTIAELTSK